MKRIIISLFALLAIGASSAQAFPDIWPREKSVLLKYDFAVAANISTYAVVIDLSDVTNFPHKSTREINIVDLKVSVDKAAASTGTVKMGVVNFVNASTGSVTWFHELKSEQNVSNTEVVGSRNPTPATYRCRVDSAGNAVNGTTPWIYSNDKTTGSTIFQTDQVLPSPSGNVAPKAGDIVLGVANGAGAIEVLVEVFYFAH